MVFTALANYGAGIYIERHAASKKAKAGMIAAVVLNLTLLVSFKYGGFIYDNINYWLPLPFSRPSNTLPVGISFYTFMVISYVVDIYRGEIKAQRNPLNFLMFISLFQHLVAGPIVRYSQIETQIQKRSVDWA